MRKGLVTVVLPIYNVERYLDRCINSVVNQTYSNLEIILVDDGSPDNCPMMCDHWERRDSRIKVIHKENAGVGYARNTGIENATGEYICFFDSDDYIALDTIEKAYRAATKENADVVSFGYCQMASTGNLRESFVPCVPQLIYSGDEVQNIFLPNLIGPDSSTGEVTNLWMSVCGGLFSMELIHRSNWRLVSERDIISEDTYSLLCLYRDVRKAVVIPEALYFYCENRTSLTHTYKPDRLERNKRFYRGCLDACDQYGYSDKVRQRLSYPFLSNMIAAMKMIVATDVSRTEQIRELDTVVRDDVLQSAICALPLTREKLMRRLLLEAARRKNTLLCYLMLRAKG